MEASVFSLSEVPFAAEYLSLMKEGTKAECKAEFHLGGQHVGINLHTSSNTVRMRNMETTQHNVDDAVVRFNLGCNGLGGQSLYELWCRTTQIKHERQKRHMDAT